MKRFLLPLLLLTGLTASAQLYYNEWIDYSRTYYKFKVPATGLYRINQPALAAIGLGGTPAEQFQLWRNGQQIPLYTTVQTGAMGASDYIEFWGEMNDGKPDKDLYRISDHQLNDKVSLETDTAFYFLTVNPAGNNLRLVPTTNSLPTALTPEPYFIHTTGKYYREKYHLGYAAVVGEYVYASDYENGEGFTSNDLGTGQTRSEVFGPLFPYTGAGAPAPLLKTNATGNALNPRVFEVKVNGNVVNNQVMDYFDYVKSSIPLAPADISTGSTTVSIKNNSSSSGDRMVIAQTELIYPRLFNFGGANNFSFELPANPSGNYLEITGFNYGSANPVLYDLSNGKRYVVDIALAPVLRVVLQPSSVNRKLVMVSEDPSYPVAVSTFQQRSFVNYGAAANQGNYLIISHPFMNIANGGATPVDDYKNYRSSAAGGGYNAKVYMIDQLIDQFGYGIKQHPLAVRNFIRWARATFTSQIKFILLIGKGLNYIHNRFYETNPDLAKLSFVPTFGYPASDNLLAAEGLDVVQKTPIGRISAINGNEVAIYLNKVKQYEQQLAFRSPLISDKAWQKNVVHIIGGGDGPTGDLLTASMNGFKRIIADTFYGANVNTFSKLSSAPVEQTNPTRLYNLFEEGIGLITYFGHSSSSTLEFNVDNPDNYNNVGKYPLFILLGCNASNFYNFNLARLSTKETISEKFVLADQKGSIATIASTHLGIIYYLDIINGRTMNASSVTSYGQTMGEVLKQAIKETFDITTQSDYYARFECEQSTLHGDPALKLMTFDDKPDYAIEDNMLTINPSFISVADNNFTIKARFMNLAKAINTPTVIEMKRVYPDQTYVIERDTIPGIRYMDSLTYSIPIVASRDKGVNKVTITIDPDNTVAELYKSNNSITKDFFIYEDEIRPVYPYNFAIINKQNIKFAASTANPFSVSRQYTLEVDTTELFNSAFKKTQTITSAGGVIEFNPVITFTDSTVYYWRVSPVPVTGSPVWNNASFIYLANSERGFNQSHYFQHLKSTGTNVSMHTYRSWAFDSVSQNLFVRNTIFPEGGTQQSEFTVSVNGVAYIGGGCNYNAVILNVFNPVTLAAWKNDFSGPGGGGLYESLPQPCGPGRGYNFEYSYLDTAGRRKMMNFLNNVVPDGYYVVARANVPSTSPSPPAYPNVWKNDTLLYGSGNSLYHLFKNQGFATLDSFNRPRTWIFIYRKNRQAFFQPTFTMAETIYDKLTLNADIRGSGYKGYIKSPLFGPARNWKSAFFNGTALPDPPGADSASVDIIGVDNAGVESLLATGIDPSLGTYDISGINPSVYPHIRLGLYLKDSVNLTAYQLKRWSVTYDPVPEGAIAPNIYLKVKDSLDLGEPLDFKVAFKNISEVPFDSLRIKMVITDRNNVAHIIPLPRKRPLVSNDTLQIGALLNTGGFAGRNTLYIDANPDNDQPEQYHFNNFAYRNIYVKPDSLNPLLDVTFDGQHILNRDIVSSKPDILVKLKDEARWMILDDTSLLTLQVRFPNGSLRRYYFNNDTLRFNPAGQAPNPDNTATINFRPYFATDGEYELIVTGKDKSNNSAGAIAYRVIFEVINKPMISNMLNYPNPFTSSTAFVFTITGNEVPQNIKIEIMTITGKIVREITKDELGPLHIGRNITEFKWDGTDQYGQKLANGVYLYRVVTNLNGKALDKYRADGDKTDKYFNKGYGKMYLMR